MKNSETSSKSIMKSRPRSKSGTRKSVEGTSGKIVEEDETKIKCMENHFNSKWGISVSVNDIGSIISNLHGHKRLVNRLPNLQGRAKVYK